MQLQRAVQSQWAKCSFLPELNILLQFLQKFIINTSWKHAHCSQLQMRKIESNLNNLLSIIQGQKLYGRQYWRESQRRVQASTVHYFIYLKMLILALTPDSCRSLSEALLNKKLCVQINRIEDLINHFLANLKPLYDFLHRSKFAQQKSLTGELFQSITKFWQSLPQMTKTGLQQVPKIMRYICLNNPLDPPLLTFHSSQLFQIRKKSETIQEGKGSRKNKRNDTWFDRKSDNLVSIQNNYQRKHYESSGKTESKAFNDEQRQKKKTFFKFKKEVLENTHSFSQVLQKSSTIISQDTIKNKLSPVKPLDRFRSTTFIPQQFPTELKVRNSVNTNRLTIQKPRLDGQHRDRLATKSAFSDLSIQKRKLVLQKCEQQEIQRRTLKKTNKGKFKIRFNTISSMIFLQTGKAKGWALIRQHINQKIVKSQLEKLLQF